MKVQFDFSGSTVVISGGTSGIGAGIARGFAEAGAHVLALGIETGLDVRREETVREALAGVARIDVLVNAAGVIRRGAEQRPEVFAEVLDINLNGAMRMCAASYELLRASRGSVLNIASMLSFFGSGPAPAYSASKGGLAQLTKSLAVGWAPDGIRVNALAPGWIETPLTGPLREDAAKSEAIIKRTPLGRWGQPEDVAGAALFLASEGARFVTGAVLPVDGGYLIA
ncbi:MAG: SDR family oxidoreductase [Bryobacter sp.]|jgi:NAD(P)-dependent dehydrogenase (short-subunit alcohol dehydrogenase family)|nr:SDR family oxidoreductase [Bryobacter sp. CoA8 C33]